MMIKKIGLIGAALATVAGGTLAAAPANAQYYGGYSRGHYGNGYYGNRGYYGSRYGNGYYGNRSYYGNRYGTGYYGNRSYYGRNSYSYRCRGSGTTGTVLGAIVGGLLGDAAVGRHGDGTAGAIVGAGVGALAGRAIERSGHRC
ncbi:hypothetical protein SCH01S_39_00820 [Sphingomonas changbaiensis NBRC 104936]|uniref:17 kDa surface antigen n=1 Tax=Sphingomonas changbaiensis NBRC 104936 TaxID=1219043 RepID=A0A0E9MPU1_9SPHN|nr:glycine zipper 2TM domain-containing protein [Sphingomonas changbaiensis]GAO39797.1 hypothetical protein SCH01S_39_00820 [Sphingomonas changbaiensis NBRC 104936]